MWWTKNQPFKDSWPPYPWGLWILPGMANEWLLPYMEIIWLRIIRVEKKKKNHKSGNLLTILEYLSSTYVWPNASLWERQNEFSHECTQQMWRWGESRKWFGRTQRHVCSFQKQGMGFSVKSLKGVLSCIHLISDFHPPWSWDNRWFSFYLSGEGLR